MTDENAKAAAENAAIDAELASLQTMVRSGAGSAPRGLFADSDPGDEAKPLDMPGNYEFCVDPAAARWEVEYHRTQPYGGAYATRLYDPYAGLLGADRAGDELLRVRQELAALRRETAETARSMCNLSSLLSCILGARASSARPEDQIAVLQDLAAFVGLDVSRITIKVQR